MQTLPTRRPLISIGMPVFNSSRTIAQAIASILNQTFADWELLIMDDGSTDNTSEIASSFADPRIVVCRFSKNMRIPTRLNHCISMAKGKFFARMDGDDIAYPDRLACQLEFLCTQPDVDLVAGWIVVFKSDGTVRGALRGSMTHEEIGARDWMGMLMPHPTWMGRTDWFRRNPYRIINAAEDQDLLIRTYHQSRFATIPRVVLGYREDGLSLLYRLFQRQQVFRSIVANLIQKRQYSKVPRCVLTQAVKGMAEVVAISTGLNYHLLRARARPIRADELRDWQSVWERVRCHSDLHEHAPFSPDKSARDHDSNCQCGELSDSTIPQ
jgi:glycosyltransferase involved in cell wall biosynthesis